MPAEQDLSNKTTISDEEQPSQESGLNQNSVVETFVDAFVGTTFLNYKIVSVIGQGATGTVYKANHLLLEKDFAIKILHPHLCSDPDALKRFTQEARSASKLEHHRIIAVHNFGVMPDGRPFLSMDFIDGMNLAELIGSKALAPDRALRLCSLVCDALTEAHNKGVIHRDIKPSNILVLNCGTSKEDIKVVDFGIAKVTADSKLNHLTHTGQSIGSPPYMSPEQCQARPLDARSDLYSLGCVLYEMLTAAPPFKSDSVYDIVSQHLNSYPDSIARYQPSLVNVVELDALVLQSLAKDPQRRFQTASDMKQAMEAAQQSVSAGYAVSDRAKAWYSVVLYRYFTKRAALIALLVVSSTIPCAITFQMMSKPQPRPLSSPVETIDKFQVGRNFNALLREARGDLAKSNWSKAEKNFRAALEQGKWLGEENPSYQAGLTGLATALDMQGKDKAAQTLRARLALLEKFADDRGDILTNSSRITLLTTMRVAGPQEEKRQKQLLSLLANQSVLYWTERDNANAVMCANSAIDIASAAGLMADPSTLKALGTLTRASSDNYQFEQAAKLCDKLLKLAQLLPGDSPSLAAAFDCQGRYYYRRSTYLLGNASEQEKAADAQRSLDWYARAKKIWTAAYGDSSPWLADNLADTGTVLCFKKQFPEAVTQIALACNMNKKIRGMQDPRTGRAYYILGQTQVKWLEASHPSTERKHWHLEEADKALKIAETVLQKDSSKDAETLLSVAAWHGRVFEYLKNYAAAEQNYEKAFSESLRIDPGNDAAKYSYAGLMRIYQIQNREKDIEALMSSVRAAGSQPEPK